MSIAITDDDTVSGQNIIQVNNTKYLPKIAGRAPVIRSQYIGVVAFTEDGSFNYYRANATATNSEAEVYFSYPVQ